MKKWLLLIPLFFPALVFAQDCSGKIKAAKMSKAAGDYRKALAQFTAAVSSCSQDRRAEIETDILDIYDKIERLKDEAVKAQQVAKAEAENAKAAEQRAAKALSEAQKAKGDAQAAYDSLKIVLTNLDKANTDKVSLILAEVARKQQELNFAVALDKIKTAKLLRALPDSVDRAYLSLSNSLLSHAREDIKSKAYTPALAKIKIAEELNAQPDSVATVTQELRHFLLENTRFDILKTDYDAAVEKINAMNTLRVPPDSVSNLWFEVAFCYAETGRFDHAAGLLDSVAQLRKNMTVRGLLGELTGKESGQKAQILREARQKLDPQQNDILSARYLSSAFGKIPGGTLTLGSPPHDESHGTCPITINPFMLGTKEVTFFEYDLFCSATNRQKPADNGWGRGHRPVIDVDWYDALEYCNWRSRQEGLQEAYLISKSSDISNSHDTSSATKTWSVTYNLSANGYRLPTEAEWEFAAGNGEKHTRYAWGNDPPRPQNGGNVADEMAKTKFPDWKIFSDYSDGFAYTAPTGSYPPNNFGLHDMTGNVWEWCWDVYNENYCHANKNKNSPHEPVSGARRILRSGSWGSFPTDCFVSNRFHNTPDTRNFSIGFRLAKN